PKGVQNPPVVVYLYSYPETVARFEVEPWILSAVGQGYAAVGFSSGVTGDGENRALPRDVFFGRLGTNLVRSAHDIQLVLDFLASRRDVNLDRVGLFGSGSGAAAAILASAVDSRIKVLDLYGPWGAWPEFFTNSSFLLAEKRGAFVTTEYLESLAWIDPV